MLKILHFYTSSPMIWSTITSAAMVAVWLGEKVIYHTFIKKPAGPGWHYCRRTAHLYYIEPVGHDRAAEALREAA